MSFTAQLVDFFWPYLKKKSPVELGNEIQNLKDDYLSISNASWGKNSTIFLEELRRMYDEEQERRRAADSKASNYLLVAAALMPILTYFGGLLGNTPALSKTATIVGYAATFAIVVVVTYIMGFVWWSFRALKASAYQTLGTSDLVAISTRSTASTRIDLIKFISKAIRSNQDQTNIKVTYVNLSHQFLFRIFIVFSIIAILQCCISFISKEKLADTPKDNHVVLHAYSSLRTIAAREPFFDLITNINFYFEYPPLALLPIATIDFGIPNTSFKQIIKQGDEWSFNYKNYAYYLKIVYIDEDLRTVTIELHQK